MADAVLAIRLAQVLDLVAAEEVSRARENHGITWADVGATFDTSAQSAHTRLSR